MFNLVLKRLVNAFKLTYDLFSLLSEEQLVLKLGTMPSNTIGQQAWCIVGARESNFLAIQLGEWQGFSCSFTNTTSKSLILEKLQTTANSISKFIKENKNQGIKKDYVIDMLEHEIQHHGQLIRFCYANKIPFPEDWKDYYSLE